MPALAVTTTVYVWEVPTALAPSEPMTSRASTKVTAALAVRVTATPPASTAAVAWVVSGPACAEVRNTWQAPAWVAQVVGVNGPVAVNVIRVPSGAGPKPPPRLTLSAAVTGTDWLTSAAAAPGVSVSWAST